LKPRGAVIKTESGAKLKKLKVYWSIEGQIA
jgi:hypothetical protein